MMAKKLAALLLGAGVVLSSLSALAQRPEGTITQASVTLLASPQVRKEIKLSKAQESAVESEYKRLNEQMKGIFKKQPTNEKEAKAAQSKVIAAQMEFIKRLDSKLDAKQRSRIREIALQQAGPFAVLSPELKKELSIDAAQVKKIENAQKELVTKIRALQAKRQKELQGIPQPKDPKDEKAVADYKKKAEALIKKYGPGDAKTLAGYKKTAEAKVLAALTAGQRTKWKSLQGAPFKPAV